MGRFHADKVFRHQGAAGAVLVEEHDKGRAREKRFKDFGLLLGGFLLKQFCKLILPRAPTALI